MKSLGRKVPSDWRHVERYPLNAAPVKPSGVPVVLGINWYTGFDAPVKGPHGTWWIGLGGLGSVRGGHCVCVPPDTALDSYAWWSFYNQGAEGSCIGFGSSRCMSILNRARYDARWLWDIAKSVDEWPDTNPGDDNGTSVRAAFDVLRSKGHVRWKPSYAAGDLDFAVRDARVADVRDGVQATRWAASAVEVVDALGNDRYRQLGAVPILNSWGHDYPHVVYMPLGVLDRLISEDGEAAVPTDR